MVMNMTFSALSDGGTLAGSRVSTNIIPGSFNISAYAESGLIGVAFLWLKRLPVEMILAYVVSSQFLIDNRHQCPMIEMATTGSQGL